MSTPLSIWNLSVWGFNMYRPKDVDGDEDGDGYGAGDRDGDGDGDSYKHKHKYKYKHEYKNTKMTPACDPKQWKI